MNSSEFLLETLEALGIDRTYIKDMNVTTTELGLTSMDLFKISAALFEQYEIKLILKKENAMSLNKLVKEIQKLQKEKVMKNNDL